MLEASQPEPKTGQQVDDESIEVRDGAHWLVQILKALGVEFVFGTTGAGMPEIQDAMVVVKPPKWIQGLNEFTTVCAANGYALASGRAGVALIDRVCGTLNAAGAFYAAFLSSSPMVVLASSNVPGVPLPAGGLDYHYSSNPSSPVAPWVKWANTLESLDNLPEEVGKCFFMALSEHQGPTYLTVRQDLAGSTVPRGKARLAKLEQPYLSPRVPDETTLKKIVNEILSSSSTQVVTSQIGRHPESVESLVELAHTLGVGVSETRFFVNYPFSDELHTGFVDIFASLDMLPSTDLVFAIEIGLLPHQRFKVPVIDMTSDPFHRQDVSAGGDYGSSMNPALMRLACDAGPTLRKLAEIARQLMTSKERESAKDRIARFVEVHRRNVDEWRSRGRQSFDAGRLDGWSIGYAISRHWSPEMILADGTMSLNDQMVRTIEIDTPGSYFGNPSAHLGATVGLSYGIALAHRNYVDVLDRGSYKLGRINESKRPVVCTLGDGEATMGNIPSALWTCQHYGIGVLYVILNNACWAAEWSPFGRIPNGWAKEAGDYEFLDLDNPRFDFSKIAGAVNVRAEKITTIERLDSALEEGLKHVRASEPFLLDIWMDKFTGPGPSVVP